MSHKLSSLKRSFDAMTSYGQVNTNKEFIEDEPRHNKMTKTSASFGPNFWIYLLENDSQSFKKTMSSLETSYWKEAVSCEIKSIMRNHIWKLIDLPLDNKPEVYKWIFKKKMKVDGSINKYKGRLLAKWYKKIEGLDYLDTYLLVTRITFIRMLIAALNSLEICQIDVNIAFLNGELDEEIYME